MSQLCKLTMVICIITFLSSCNNIDKAPAKGDIFDMHKVYQVRRLNQPMNIDANWSKPNWRKIKPLDIRLFMGEKPRHLPKTQAKVLYDDENIYVIFRVEDRYIRAVATGYRDRVWQDSCVEFFFTPGEDISDGYFNLETNCGGTFLCRHQRLSKGKPKFLEEADCKGIEIAHSMPKIVKPEIQKPTTWTLEYRIPIGILQKYCKVTKPAPGVKWRANFYKCADKTSHPHWLTWSFVDKEKPAFHVPEYFGTLEFVE